ncbi:MAG: 4Fe-4S dicluster domain-containing protein [Candidatus Brocadiia bacterium]
MTTATSSRAVRIRVDRCVACKSCELACAKAHAGFEDIAEALLSDAHLIPRVHVIDVEDHNVPVQCRHCENAPCVEACPTGALYKAEDGRVLTDREKCISCKACVRVCPYEAVSWDEEADVAVKCDVCEGLIAGGDDPYCVRACPTSALVTVTVEEAHAGEESEQYDALLRDESRTETAGPGVKFDIDSKECICCGRCAKNCPVDCIDGKRGKPPARAKPEDEEKGKVGEPFVIDQEECIHCGTCHEICPVGAVKRS